MKKEKILSTLEDVARTLHMKVRQEKGDFAGGSCIKDDEPIILLNKRHMIDKRINVLARELASFDLSRMVIPKPVIDIINSERKRASEIEAELEDTEE
jgi:hypothetical protein